MELQESILQPILQDVEMNKQPIFLLQNFRDIFIDLPKGTEYTPSFTEFYSQSLLKAKKYGTFQPGEEKAQRFLISVCNCLNKGYKESEAMF